MEVHDHHHSFWRLTSNRYFSMLRLFFVSVNSGIGHGDISPGKAYILSLVYNLALEKKGSICYNYGVAVCPFSQARKGDNQWERLR